MANNIAIRGGTASGASLSVTHSGETVNGTYTAPTVTQPTASSLRYLKSTASNTNAFGLQIGITKAGSGAGAVRYGPKTYGVLKAVTETHASRVICDDFSDEDVQAAVLVGGTADIYRVTNGVMSRVTSAPITGGNWAQWSLKGRTDQTTFDWQIPDVTVDGKDYMVGVAAVDAGGLLGAVGTATFTYADNSGTAGTGTSPSITLNYNPGGALAAPANVTATVDATHSRLLHVSWDAVSGATGYIFFICWHETSAANIPSAPYLEVAGGAQAGDMLIARNAIMQPDILNMVSHRWAEGPLAWGIVTDYSAGVDFDLLTSGDKTAEVKKFGAGDVQPDPDAGSYYQRWVIGTDTATTRRVFAYTFAGPAYSCLRRPAMDGETWHFETWLRASSTVNGELRCTGFSDTPITITTSWQKFTKEVTFTADGTAIYEFSIYLDAGFSTPVTVDMAGSDIYETSEGRRLWSADEVAKAPAGAMVRTHEWVKQEPEVYTPEMVTDKFHGGPFGDTLDTYFAKVLQIGGIPWLQFEMMMGVDAWLDILAYINAPVASGHPMALKRQANGRTAPWSDAFPRILCEFGNEAWNTSTGKFWQTVAMTDQGNAQNVTAGAVYGHLSKIFADELEASAHWTSKIQWVLGGQTILEPWADCIETFAKPCLISDAMYNLHPTADKVNWVIENAAGYADVAGDAAGASAPYVAASMARYEARALAAGLTFGPGQDMWYAIYEAGPFTDNNWYANTDDSQLVTMLALLYSRLGGTATLETMCHCLAGGAENFSFFMFRPGYIFASHAYPAFGGGVHPCYRLPAILHERAGKSKVHEFTTIRDNDVTVWNRADVAATADKTFAFGFQSDTTPGRWVLVVGNRDTVNTADITLCTPFRSHTSAQVWANVGDFREHNMQNPGFRWAERTTPAPPKWFEATVADPLSVAINIEPQAVTITDPSRITIDNTVGADATGLLPGNCLLIELEGVT